jgi:hypothetical protein
MAAAIVLPLFGLTHVPDDDVDSLALGAAVHHARTQFERVIERTGDQHCLACHLLRALSGADVARERQPVPPDAFTQALRPQTLIVASAPAQAFSPRGPPIAGSATPGLRPAFTS